MGGEPRHGLPARLRDRVGEAGLALYALAGGVVAVAAVALAALLLAKPLLFPSLGPTALLFFEHPLQRSASPRNAIGGHLLAAAVGHATLVIFGLVDDPAVLVGGITLARVAATSVSLAVTGCLLVALRVRHPPAGATTLTVTLGLFPQLSDLAFIAGGVVLLTVVAILVNRAIGVQMPLWDPLRGDPDDAGE